MGKFFIVLRMATAVAGEIQKAAADGEITEDEALDILKAAVKALGLDLRVSI